MVYRIILLHTDNSGVGRKLKVCVVWGGRVRGTRLKPKKGGGVDYGYI